MMPVSIPDCLLFYSVIVLSPIQLVKIAYSFIFSIDKIIIVFELLSVFYLL